MRRRSVEALINVAASFVTTATTISEMEVVISEAMVATEEDFDKEVATEALTETKTKDLQNM